MDAQCVKEVAEHYGKVKEAIRPPEANFVFLCFADDEAAKSCLANGITVDGKEYSVQPSKTAFKERDEWRRSILEKRSTNSDLPM